MSAILASSTWSAPSPARPAATPDAPGDPGECPVRRWVLRRNCSVTPAQMGAFYLSLSLVSLGIGVFFAVNGAVYVLGFAGLEVLAVGVALLLHARHCADSEMLCLRGGRLEAECVCGASVRREIFDAAFVRIDCEPGALVRVSGQGRSLLLGRHLRPHLREPLARELRRALREAVA